MALGWNSRSPEAAWFRPGKLGQRLIPFPCKNPGRHRLTFDLSKRPAVACSLLFPVKPGPPPTLPAHQTQTAGVVFSPAKPWRAFDGVQTTASRRPTHNGTTTSFSTKDLPRIHTHSIEERREKPEPSMADRGGYRGRGGGRGGRGGGHHGRGGGASASGGGGAAGTAAGAGAGAQGERPKKENILDLKKYMDQRITVKFNGGREGEFVYPKHGSCYARKRGRPD